MKTFHLPLFALSAFMLAVCLTTAHAQKAETLPDWNVAVKELSQLNSPYRDVNMSITPNGKYLYFMSGRGQQPWSRSYVQFRGRPEYDGDLWFSRLDNGEWSKPQCAGQPICTSSGEDEPNISADGQTIYFQSWKSDWRITGGPYYRAELQGTQWGKSKGLGGGISQFFQRYAYATDGMSISPDGKVFVVAAGPDYDGAMDLFISRKGADGAWSYPQKLSVSTAEDERSVYIAGDNKTLYFGSAGWGGFGKLDIFKTTLEKDAQCGPVVNIGKPFNTREEDYGFVIDALRNDVYFVRNSDIFYAHLGEQADERIKPTPMVVMDGEVKLPDGKGVEAHIALINTASQDTVARARSNAETGEYSLSFSKKDGKYLQIIKFNDQYIEEIPIEIGPQTPALLNQPIMADPKRMKQNKPTVKSRPF